jgi:dTDP-4-dehydrorhamnose 3,5-epimerase
MVELRRLTPEGLIEIRPRRFADDRGFFSETWNEAVWREAGIATVFVQDNHSLSRARGTLRGLHFQSPPAAQAKLVRVTRGSAFDVAVDLRPGSPTYRQWAGVTLSAEEWNQLMIPEGFAHGFLTLEPDTEVQYKASAAYSPANDRAIRFDDPTLAIDWPLPVANLILSDRDRAAPLLADQETGF